LTSFNEFNLAPETLNALNDMGFSSASPIQSKAIPILKAGLDIIGQAETGTGKTAAFAIPSLELLDENLDETQILVLCPTRELVVQVAGEFTKLAKYRPSVQILAIYGGQNISIQLKALKSSPQVVIGTTGRVLDHIRRRTLKLENIKTVILDEADQMLDMGFRDDIDLILKETPAERQTVMFTATLTRDLMRLMEGHQRSPEHISTMSTSQKQSKQIKQFYYNIKGSHKLEALKRLLHFYRIKSALVFCNTKLKVDELAKDLMNENFSTAAIHGDMDQRKRDKVMEGFRDGSVEILVATDVAARGIDVDNLSAVVNFDLPRFDQDYVHRIGRTGRAGKDGYAFTFIVGKETEHLQRIARKNNMNIEEAQVPSAKDLEDNEIESIKEIINKINLSENATEKYKNLLGKFGLENKSPEEISLALLKLLLVSRVRIKSNIDFQPEEIVKRERSKAKRPFRSSFQDYRGERNSSGRDRKEKSFSSSMRPARKPSPSKYFSKAKSLVK